MPDPLFSGPTAPRPTVAAELVACQFEFGRAFPSDDPVGLLVLGLAAIHNDLVLMNRLLVAPAGWGDPLLTDPERQALLRVVLAQVWEAHLLIQDATTIPTLEAFLSRVADHYDGGSEKGRALLDALKGEAGATAPAMRQIMRLARNATNHYPRPDDEDLTSIIGAMADQTGVVAVGETMNSVRMVFADEVMARYSLRGLSGSAEDEVQAALVALLDAAADSVIALIHLSQTALDLWLAGRDVTSSPAGRDPRRL